MDKNLKLFVLTDVILVSIFFLVFGGLWFGASSGIKFLEVLVAISVLSLIEADLVHRFSGVPLSKRKFGFAKAADFSHHSMEIMNKYWDIQAIVFLGIGVLDFVTFHLSQWRNALGIGVFFMIIVAFRLYHNRTTIKGIKKKELFQ